MKNKSKRKFLVKDIVQDNHDKATYYQVVSYGYSNTINVTSIFSKHLKSTQYIYGAGEENFTLIFKKGSYNRKQLKSLLDILDI